MKKKLQKDAEHPQREEKSLKLHKETLTQLKAADLRMAAGMNRSVWDTNCHWQ